MKIKCNEVVSRNFNNLFDYNLDYCNKCFTFTHTKIGHKDILYFRTNEIFSLVKNLNSLELKKTLIYLVKNEFLYNDLEIYEKLDSDRIIIIEEMTCDF